MEGRAYARCVIETKNLFYDESNRPPPALPTAKDFQRLQQRIDRAKESVASHKLLGQGSDVTAPLALLSVQANSTNHQPSDTQIAVPAHPTPPSTYHPKWKIRKVLVGHTGWVRCLDVEPENEWFVSGGNDRLLKIWDLASGELRLTLTGHIHAIRAVKISSTRPYIFSGAEDHMIKCWDLEQNQVVRQYRGHMSSIYDIAIHPRLDIIASAGRDSTVRIWDMRSQDEVMCLRGHNNSVLSLIAQDHEPQLISGSSDKIIRCWDLRMAKARTILTHHSKSIRALAAHPRKWQFISGAADGVKIFEGENSNFSRDFKDQPNSIINAIALKDDPKSSVAVLGCDNGLLQFYDYETGMKFQNIESTPVRGSIYSEAGINALCFDKSETRLLTGESDKTIRIWQEEIHPEEEL